MHLQPVGNESPDDAVALAGALVSEVRRAVRGKDDAVRLAVVALLSGNHLLVEDTPGTGKTLLARSLAAVCGGRFRRVQCTPDLLPSDLTGTTVYAAATNEWQFRPGPVFANVLLVDELNRASPRTQSALLEPLEEHQVTVDGATYALPEPFCCIATQNPFGSAGTFALPESQLDRFGLVLTLGVPDREAEREILRGTGGSDVLPELREVATPDGVLEAMAAVRMVYVAPMLLEYVLDIGGATRRQPGVALGASPRATKGLLHVARAHALVCGRVHLSPDDVQAVAAPALAHRLTLDRGANLDEGAQVVADVLARVPVPRP
ncbi:MAG TPA: MoxR family ATPase [Acidimicrobiia bacterium]|jgi:MoxR-like ATPase